MENIKEEIGRRIYEARKAKGLTRQALSELTEYLKPSRIGNWENGIRTPGPEEIKQLAKVLDLSPAYLMCLTHEKNPNKKSGLGALIPVLNHKQACEPEKYMQIIQTQGLEDVTFVPIGSEIMQQIGQYTFAVKMIDDSMMPEIRIHDLLIITTGTLHAPGDYVVVKINGKSEIIICQYKKLSYTKDDFALITLNDNWPNITPDESMQVIIIGKVLQIIRTC